MCVSLLLVRYNDVAGVWRSNLLVSQMDLTLATKTERDSDSESSRERREDQKGGREREGGGGRQQAGTLLGLARNSSQAALMLKLILVHTQAHTQRPQHTHTRTHKWSQRTDFICRHDGAGEGQREREVESQS